MNFIFHRDRVIASTSGHILGFKKGVPTHVPPEAIKDVIAAGGMPEDETFDPDPPKGSGPQEPTDPTERQLALFTAFETLIKRNRREDFTAGGMPHQKALAVELGWPVAAKERDAAWVEFHKGSTDK